MKIVVYRPQLKEVDASYMKTDKNYINFLRNTNPEIDIISKTDKKFIENLSSFLQPESKVILDTSSIKKFVKSLYDAKIFVETEKKVKKESLTKTKSKKVAKK
jgi:predicted RND superfamily exporter protein